MRGFCLVFFMLCLCVVPAGALASAPTGGASYAPPPPPPPDPSTVVPGPQPTVPGTLAVLLPDGTQAYTRDGSFQTDSNGQLVTSSGFVIQPAITIPANAEAITVGRDGVVSVKLPGTVAPTQVGSLQLATFINPAGLESRGENLYVETGASGNPNLNVPGTNGAGVLMQGYVESSNVNVVEEMVNMIQTQRAYEINSKAITTSDQMLQKLSQL